MPSTQECANELVLKHPSVVGNYRDMHDNAQYAASADARELFSKGERLEY